MSAARLDRDDFVESSTLLWPSKQTRVSLPRSTPEQVRRLYEAGLTVKAIDPDSFMVKVRRAIEAICIDKGAKEYDQDGIRVGLSNMLRQIERDRIFSRGVLDVLHHFTYIGNIAAHAVDETVKPEVADLADELFRLLIQYIYEMPQKLERLKKETQTLTLRT